MFSFSQFTLANIFSSNVSPIDKEKHESNGLVATIYGLKNINYCSLVKGIFKYNNNFKNN
jgi:hypothetical protein